MADITAAHTAPADTDRSDTGVVDRLLSDRTHHIEFNGHLTNHVKHAVVALAGLGVEPERISAYHDNYVKLTPYGFPVEPARRARLTITDDNWLQFLGQRTDFAAYCDFFDRRERELGMPEVLRRYLPHLLPGWVGALQHATIHLGWAWMRATAGWPSRALLISPSPTSPATRNVPARPTPATPRRNRRTL